MRVVVLGAGVIGVSTAYHLLRAGHEVTVVDRQPGPGLETSFANGGQVSASHATPWSNPSTPLKLLGWLGRKNAPLCLRFSTDPALWRFLLRFIANCRAGPSAANAAKVLKLALYNRPLLADIRAHTGVAFDAEERGILHLYRSEREMELAVRQAERFRALGLELEDLNASACTALEPALEGQRDTLAGGIFSPGDLSGDAHAFTHGLAQFCADAGVAFKLEHTITRIAAMGGRVTGVMTDRGMITADRYVLALGSYAPLLLRPLGIRIPIYPAKGYSATVPVGGTNAAPRISLTDDDAKIVISRLGSRLRIAGTAEFDGYNTALVPERARAVLDAGAALFPGALDLARAEFWAGLRPLTPDGVPVIGRTPLANLILNTGHGTLGWTLASASGRIAADLAGGAEPDFDTAGLGPERF
ncbi:MAG: D-amino acid dehydrogenase [Alphaproteobacteria bacterium]|nr:D-amino acid dehydrogenase [Alphaproteobacteria bacterium]